MVLNITHLALILFNNLHCLCRHYSEKKETTSVFPLEEIGFQKQNTFSSRVSYPSLLVLPFFPLFWL